MKNKYRYRVKIGNKEVKKYGNKKMRARVRQAIKQEKEMPIIEECENFWNWD